MAIVFCPLLIAATPMDSAPSPFEEAVVLVLPPLAPGIVVMSARAGSVRNAPSTNTPRLATWPTTAQAMKLLRVALLERLLRLERRPWLALMRPAVLSVDASNQRFVPGPKLIQEHVGHI